MLVKEVIKLAAANLGRDDLVKATDSLTQPTGELLSLLRCYNLIENEIALEYLPLKMEESLLVSNGTLPFMAFLFAPVEILHVTADGRELDFASYHDKIVLDYHGRVQVQYAYSPEEKGWDNEGAFGAKVSSRLLSFGVACEFCLSRGLFSEASVWQKRYQDALRAASFSHKKRCVRSRRWV